MFVNSYLNQAGYCCPEVNIWHSFPPFRLLDSHHINSPSNQVQDKYYEKPEKKKKVFLLLTFPFMKLISRQRYLNNENKDEDEMRNRHISYRRNIIHRLRGHMKYEENV